MPSVLAIIPARGGSKGIPRKNLVELGGKPLLVHSIEHARCARSIERVVVSTDDAEIADVARAHGAEVPCMRPAELAGDHVLDLPVFQHMLRELETRERYVPSIVVHLRPTAPWRKQGWIDEAVEALNARADVHSVRSVSPVTQHPYRVFEVGDAGLLQPVMAARHPQPYVLRRQDLPAMYYYNCVIDVARRSTILELESMTGNRILPYMMSSDETIDIDSARDLAIAKAIFWGES
jgi:N-acylneuraminate cytidylyltransferase